MEAGLVRQSVAAYSGTPQMARRFTSLVSLLLLLVIAAGGCGQRGADSGVTDASAESTPPLTIAVIPKSVGGEFWETVEQGARDAAKELNVAIKWEGPHAETELAEQNKIIENMVNLGVDGMALAPLNNRTMQESVENVVAAGIPVVIFDSAVDGDAHTSFVATDNTAGGVIAAKYIIERLGDGNRRLFLLRFIQGTASTEQRSQGFLDTAKAAGFDVLADPYCDDATVAGAKRTATNVLEQFVKDGRFALDGMFATNLYSTMGLLEALKDLRDGGVEVDAVVVGFDTSPGLIRDLQAGNIDALVSQNPLRMGYLAVETTVRLLHGEKVEPRIDTGVELVTADRLEKESAIRKLVGLE
jgi:ribose transport system substrate-binding protein